MHALTKICSGSATWRIPRSFWQISRLPGTLGPWTMRASRRSWFWQWRLLHCQKSSCGWPLKRLTAEWRMSFAKQTSSIRAWARSLLARSTIAVVLLSSSYVDGISQLKDDVDSLCLRPLTSIARNAHKCMPLASLLQHPCSPLIMKAGRWQKPLRLLRKLLRRVSPKRVQSRGIRQRKKPLLVTNEKSALVRCLGDFITCCSYQGVKNVFNHLNRLGFGYVLQKSLVPLYCSLQYSNKCLIHVHI